MDEWRWALYTLRIDVIAFKKSPVCVVYDTESMLGFIRCETEIINEIRFELNLFPSLCQL